MSKQPLTLKQIAYFTAHLLADGVDGDTPLTHCRLVFGKARLGEFVVEDRYRTYKANAESLKDSGPVTVLDGTNDQPQT